MPHQFTSLISSHLESMRDRDGLRRSLAFNLAAMLMAIDNLAMLADADAPAIDHLKDWNSYLKGKSVDVGEIILALEAGR